MRLMGLTINSHWAGPFYMRRWVQLAPLLTPVENSHFAGAGALVLIASTVCRVWRWLDRGLNLVKGLRLYEVLI